MQKEEGKLYIKQIITRAALSVPADYSQLSLMILPALCRLFREVDVTTFYLQFFPLLAPTATCLSQKSWHTFRNWSPGICQGGLKT